MDNIHHNWVDLSDSWEKIGTAAAQRESQKHYFKSSKQRLLGHGHFDGLVGEELVEQLSGIKADWTLRIEGDGGTDFPGKVDVKVSKHFWDPDLKVPINTPEDKWADYYVLVAADIDSKMARLCGYVSREELIAHDRIIKYRNEEDYEYNYTMNERDLHKGLPQAMFDEANVSLT